MGNSSDVQMSLVLLYILYYTIHYIYIYTNLLSANKMEQGRLNWSCYAEKFINIAQLFHSIPAENIGTEWPVHLFCLVFCFALKVFGFELTFLFSFPDIYSQMWLNNRKNITFVVVVFKSLKMMDHVTDTFLFLSRCVFLDGLFKPWIALNVYSWF